MKHPYKTDRINFLLPLLFCLPHKKVTKKLTTVNTMLGKTGIHNLGSNRAWCTHPWTPALRCLFSVIIHRMYAFAKLFQFRERRRCSMRIVLGFNPGEICTTINCGNQSVSMKMYRFMPQKIESKKRAKHNSICRLEFVQKILYAKIINKFYYPLFLLLVFAFPLHAQNYSMEQIINYAQENSPEALKIETYKENEYWQWRTYKSEYKPQLLLNATMPAYQKNNVPVTQDDGSVVYRTTNQSIAYSALSLEQNIGFTGGKIYLSTDLSRLDDFNQNTNSYSGSPFYIGIEQPLFAFNNLKWMNKIEPLKYQESLKEYVEGNERIAYNTVVRYFNLLISQISYQIASTNKANADTIYKIGQERYSMGKISKNELLQLKFGVISSQKSMANAELSIKTSMLELGSYTGLSITENQQLSLPEEVYTFKVDGETAVQKALENSNRSIEFKRNILEARRDAEQAKRESRFQASLSLSYGQTNIAPHITGIYDNPQALQTLNVGLSVPILNWGRSKAKREKAMANLKLVEYTMQQTEINYRQEVLTETENFNMLQEFIGFTEEADKTAEERYQIAMLRYMANDISLTEYNIALEQKDQAKKEFITALRDYWLAYYFIRLLTLYDFNKDMALTQTMNIN